MSHRWQHDVVSVLLALGLVLMLPGGAVVVLGLWLASRRK